jgi:hypothetical protein
MSARLDAIVDEIGMMTTDPREWGREDLQGAVAVWDRLDRLIGELSVLRRDHAIVLANRLPDQYTAATAHGAVTVHRNPLKTEAWDGHGVLADLAAPMIDGNGERLEAVPVSILRDVLPAVAQGATSSRWKVNELRKINPGIVESRRTVTWGDVLIARGPLPYAARRTVAPDIEPSSAPQV